MTNEERQKELTTYLYEATDLPSRQHVRSLLGVGGMVGVSLGTLRWLAECVAPRESGSTATPPFHGVYNALCGTEQAIAKLGEVEWASTTGTGIRGEVQDVLSAMTRLRDILKRHGLAK